MKYILRIYSQGREFTTEPFEEDSKLVFEEAGSEEVITIPLAEYKRLKYQDRQLTHLEENGVDNWQNYSRVGDEDED